MQGTVRGEAHPHDAWHRQQEDTALSSANPFSHVDGRLHCEQVSAESIAGAHGTPCYAYSASALRGQFHTIREAFSRWEPLVCFSVKSCSNLSVLALLRECGSGFDVVSGGELHRALAAGAAPSKIVYAGVGKTEEEIEYALRSGIYMLNVESAPELAAIARVAQRLSRRALVALRVNPDVDASTHEKTTTGKKENKFGIGLSEAAKLAGEAAGWEGVEVRGIHFHLGSPVCSTQPYEQALEKMLEFIPSLREMGHQIDILNIGGGYCVSYTGEEVISPKDYAAALQRYLEKLNCQVIIEPGRLIAANSGVLLTRVIYRKETDHGKTFLICDAAMNDLVRPTLYDSFHRIWPARSDGGMPEILRPEPVNAEGGAAKECDDHGSTQMELVDVVGPICESGDYLAKDRQLPRVQAGEVLAVFSAGAYGFTMSSNYNSRPRPPEILVEGDQVRVIRKRETYEDLTRLEPV